MAKIRLCVDHPLGAGQSVRLTEAQAHYLFGVMREGPGSRVLLFNGQDGEWLAEVVEAAKRKGTLSCLDQTRPQRPAPDLWLLFAPIKKARTDLIVEKSVELGVARLQPVTTEFTDSDRFRHDKAKAHIREAAEQCGATHLPDIGAVTGLSKLLASWNTDRRILWADEARAGDASSPAALLGQAAPGPWAVLTGPQGGFSDAERQMLRGLSHVTPISLGPRILRAETAALALLTLWQAHLGDWR